MYAERNTCKILIVGEEHNYAGRNDKKWAEIFYKIDNKLPIIIVREFVDDSEKFETSPPIRNVEHEYNIENAKTDLTLLVDEFAFKYYKKKDAHLFSDLVLEDFLKLPSFKRTMKIMDVEEKSGLAWKDVDKQELEKYLIPSDEFLKAKTDVNDMMHEDYNGWKLAVLSGSDRRLLVNKDWCKNLFEIEKKFGKKCNILVIVGNMHMGSVKLRDGSIAEGMVSLLKKEPGDFSKIMWAWAQKPLRPEEFIESQEDLKIDVDHINVYKVDDKKTKVLKKNEFLKPDPSELNRKLQEDPKEESEGPFKRIE